MTKFVAKRRRPKHWFESGLIYWRYLGGKLQQEEDSDEENEDGDDLDAEGEDSEEICPRKTRLSSTSSVRISDLCSQELETNEQSLVSEPAQHNFAENSAKATIFDSPASAITSTKKQSESFLYDLYAVVNHVGALATGHYFAYIRTETDGKWKCFNDHQCKDIDEKEVVSSSAYILFYIRRDVKKHFH